MNLHKVYKDLHQIPELAFKEIKTKKYIENILKDNNISYEILSNGIIAKVVVDESFSFIGFRTELDALNIKEKNKIDFKSDKYMHACGHDMHMATVIGILIEANINKDKLKNNVIVAFQSGEETGEGAKALVNEYNWPNLDSFYAF